MRRRMGFGRVLYLRTISEKRVSQHSTPQIVMLGADLLGGHVE